MSRTFISARHRATPTHSIALAGLAYTAKTNAANAGKPAIIVATAGGLMFAAGAPAQAGTYAESTAAVQAPAPAAAAPSAGAGVHTVVSGDTLGAISARYGVSLDTVLTQNGLSYASVIYPGQQIKVSGGASVAAPAAVSPAAVPPAAPATQASFIAPVPSQSDISFASSAITPAASPAPASAVATSGAGGAIVASAYAQLGSIQDCTILVEKALRSIGKNVGDLGPLQFDQYGTRVASPAAGDLVVRPGHIGIYVGNGKVISSGMNGANLTIEHNLTDLPGSYFVRVNG
ncbi:LysM peptidoglycan-binding domain-containing protein [Arthrobacter sp. H5]|uniref:LysM peptidoglycan-binding domain-containing protein n=1 Tax=Arthrobacter sp. H5 TaxID=1267973 RepID=UPI0004811695|nr:LysM peptidoglycan-binding domain-containing protein [Arthrobacter sp. H5]